MTPLDQFLRWVLTLTVWHVVKALLVVSLGLYVIFAVVMVRQVQLMCKTVDSGSQWWLKGLTLVHLAAAIGVGVMAVVEL